MELQRNNSKGVLRWILWIIAGMVVVAFFVVFGLFRVREVDVVGNELYSAAEIEDMVMKGSLGENSLYLKWKYSQKEASENLDYLNGVEVSLINAYHIQIRVYEKEIVGYVMYSGSLVYFDKDGMVVEISRETREGVPAFSGVSIQSPEVGKKLPVTDEDFLETLLEETTLLQEVGIKAKQIHYDENQEMILYFASDLRVLLGKNSYMEEKLTNLLALFPKMEGMSGTLHMEDFTSGTTTITFKKNEKGNEELVFDIDGPEGEAGEASEETTESESEFSSAGTGYKDDGSQFTTDASGNQIYTDAAGNISYSTEKMYTNEDGSIITDGYGYIDPYTGAYILN